MFLFADGNMGIFETVSNTFAGLSGVYERDSFTLIQTRTSEDSHHSSVEQLEMNMKSRESMDNLLWQAANADRCTNDVI